MRSRRLPSKRHRTPLLVQLRRAALPAAAMALVAFFGVSALIGSNGALAYGDYQRELDQRQARLALLKQRQAVLANRVALLDPKRANPDLVDELVRKQLNVVNPDEVVVPLD